MLPLQFGLLPSGDSLCVHFREVKSRTGVPRLQHSYGQARGKPIEAAGYVRTITERVSACTSCRFARDTVVHLSLPWMGCLLLSCCERASQLDAEPCHARVAPCRPVFGGSQG